VRNFAVKFALLANRITGEKPNSADYIDLTPQGMLFQYKRLLNQEQRGILLFGFSDAALLAILDEEFEIDADRHQLLFRKTFLDTRSIRLAGIGEEGPEGLKLRVREQALIEHAAIRLLEATRHLYRYDMSEERLDDVRREYEENIRSYLRRGLDRQLCEHPEVYQNGLELSLRALMASEKSLRAFCHSMTVDAIFKADAAKFLFGDNSGYAAAWERKQLFRHMIAKSLQGLISGCVVE
jgi:hypothetical protein